MIRNTASGLPVVGVLLKHGIMAGLDEINGQEKFDVAAQQLIATMSPAFDGDAASTLVDAHRAAIRNAWPSAKDPSEKKMSMKAALSGVEMSKSRCSPPMRRRGSINNWLTRQCGSVLQR